MVLVVDHGQQAGVVAVAAQRLRQLLAPQRDAVLVAERGGEADRILDGRRLDHEAAVVVALELHAVGADRIHHVRVLDLVELALDQAGRVKAEVAADLLGAGRSSRRLSHARAQQQLRRGQRSAGHHHRVGARPRASRRRCPEYCTPVASGPEPRSSITTRCTRQPARRARGGPRPTAGGCRC